MNRKKLKQLVALAGLSMVAAPMMAQLGAIAAPTGFMTHKDSMKGDVYFGGTPNAELSVMVGGVEGKRNLTASACGIATLKPSTTRPIPATFKIGVNTITVANLPTQLLPKCLTNGQLEESRTQNFKTSDGTVVIVGQAPSASITMTYDDTIGRKVKMNACGFGKLTNSSTSPFAAAVTFTPAGGSMLTYGAIAAQYPWLCREGVTYKPVVSSGS